ncbi:MAG: AAA family ATPase, partial [Spirulina sp. SIO3F2]|nr:AAA family ATPase [Spirulina sp. SIO3F2]
MTTDIDRLEQPDGYDFSAITNALPPADLNAEAELIGVVLLDPDAYERIREVITASDFYDTAHQRIFRAIEQVASHGEPPNLPLVINHLDSINKLNAIGGTVKLASMVEPIVSSVNADILAKLVKEKSLRRGVIGQALAIAERAQTPTLPIDHTLEQAVKTVKDLQAETGSGIERQRNKIKRLVDRVKGILTSPWESYIKEDLLLQLARETNRPVNHLQTLYHKSLIPHTCGRLMSIRELRDKVGNRCDEWIAHGWYAAGSTTLFHAPGGTGKTTFLLDQIKELIQGKEWQGFPASGKRRVLFVQTDEPENRFLKSLSDRGYDDDEPNFRTITTFAVDHIPMLVAQCQEFKPDLIVIDSLTSASKFSTVSENDSVYARPLLELAELSNQMGCHTIVIHHTGRATGEARGTTALVNAVSQVIKLDHDPHSYDPNDLIIQSTKSRDRAPIKYRLHRDADTLRWELLDEIIADEAPD